MSEKLHIGLENSLEYKIRVMEGFRAGMRVEYVNLPHPGLSSFCIGKFLPCPCPIWDWYNCYYRLEAE